jgi:ribose transport system substrate-binding protein
MIKRAACVLALALPLIWTAGCGGKSDQPAPTETARLKLAVIPKGTTHEFWKSIHMGALMAADEFGVDIIWKGPQKEDDRAQQITVVEDFVSRGVDGIVLAPLDERALCRPVEDAVRENIPVVIIDSGCRERLRNRATDN